jgi:type II pantothenate kinase
MMQRPGGVTAVGVDVGATLSKLAVSDVEGEIGFEQMPSGALERLVERIRELAPAHIGLTGGGASRVAEQLDLPSKSVNEFEAWGTGAARLLRDSEFTPDSRYLLVSLGTGTSILLIDGGNAVRVGGTALGGGTVMGLGSALVGEARFERLCALAARGHRSRVDLVVGDIYRDGEIALPSELTAASFGKLGHDLGGSTSPEDLAAAVMGLVGENVALICAGLSFATQVERIVFAGSTLVENPCLRDILEEICRTSGRAASFLPTGEFGGALGALELAGVDHDAGPGVNR